MRVGLICNLGGSSAFSGGDHVKAIQYLNFLKREGVEYQLFDFYGKKRRPLTIIFSVWRMLKRCDSVLFMASTNGACFLAKTIHLLNTKKRKIFYVTIGKGPIYKFISNDVDLANLQSTRIPISNHNKGLKTALSACSVIALEHQRLVTIYADTLGLQNCLWIPNFRMAENTPDHLAFSVKGPLHIIYYSRMAEEKGPLDLLLAIRSINRGEKRVEVDFYGPFASDCFKEKFMNELASTPHAYYRGVWQEGNPTALLSKYDFLCFPTKHKGEGMPGSIVESLLASTPVISSSFPFCEELITDGENGYIYSPQENAVQAIESAINRALERREKLPDMSKKALSSAEKYKYDYWREQLLNLLGANK